MVRQADDITLTAMTTPTRSSSPVAEGQTGVRLDRWLCAARFFKTRSLAKTAIDGGKVRLNGNRAKAAKEVAVGDTLTVSRGETMQTVLVIGLAERRGSATVAATLYAETEDSIRQREEARTRRTIERTSLTPPRNRPSKRARRQLIAAKTDAGRLDEGD